MPRTPGPVLRGRTAVVTGAASGIGRALATRLARHGCPVAICDVDADGLEETAASLPTEVLHRHVDVSDRGQFMAFAAEVDAWTKQPVGLVVNNAGVTVVQTVAAGGPEDDDWLLGINLHGVMNGTRAFLPILQRQDSGVIANVSSVFGLAGFPTQSAYCASKFAVRGYTDSLRHELRDSGVSAVTIHPGGIDTNVVRNARFHQDDRGNTDHAVMISDFTKVARTSPDKAAKIIQSGIEAGKTRIRVGADAVALDLLVRIAPNRYYDVIKSLEPLARR